MLVTTIPVKIRPQPPTFGAGAGAGAGAGSVVGDGDGGGSGRAEKDTSGVIDGRGTGEVTVAVESTAAEAASGAARGASSVGTCFRFRVVHQDGDSHDQSADQEQEGGAAAGKRSLSGPAAMGVKVGGMGVAAAETMMDSDAAADKVDRTLFYGYDVNGCSSSDREGAAAASDSGEDDDWEVKSAPALLGYWAIRQLADGCSSSSSSQSPAISLVAAGNDTDGGLLVKVRITGWNMRTGIDSSGSASDHVPNVSNPNCNPYAHLLKCLG
eukprot:gene29128-4704_t